MVTYADTSALYAWLDVSARAHEPVRHALEDALQHSLVVTSNYVLAELVAVAQRRLGMEPTRQFLDEFAPELVVHWVDEDLHQSGVAAMLTAGRRDLSLVDCTSFEIMRRRGIRRVFTLDRHFAEQGFECLPGITPGNDRGTSDRDG